MEMIFTLFKLLRYKEGNELSEHLSRLRCLEAKRHGGVVRFIKKCFGKFCQNRGVMQNLRIARRADLCTGVTRVAKDEARTDTLPRKTIKYRFVRGEERAAVLSKNKSKPGRNGDAKAAALYTRLMRTTKQIQGLSISMLEIFAKEKPLTRICKLTSFVNKFNPLPQGARENGLLPYSVARVQASFAKQTDMNLSLFTSHFSRKCKRYAFTLAEVLITLGIIGVVAAVTLPSVIQKYKEKVWVTSYLRVYSILENAYQLALNEYGPVESWDGIAVVYENRLYKIVGYNNKDFIYNAFRPYLKVSREFLETKGNWNVSINCMPVTSYYLNGNKVGMSGELSHFAPTVSLISGECIAFGAAYPTHHSFFWIDTNGKKGPNTLGKDQFVFGFAQYRLAPYAWHDTANECNIYDTEDRMGLSCGAWIIRHRNMDYLHLPYEDVKSNWDNMSHYW